MSLTFIIFIVSLAGMTLIVCLKMFVFRERHVELWARTRTVSDSFIHKVSGSVKDKAVHLKRESLLKILGVAYHKIIPFAERQYRTVAGWFYRMHRKLWSTLEYSKSSAKQVSDHLKHLAQKKEDDSSNKPL